MATPTLDPKALQAVLNILARAQASVSEHTQIHNAVQALVQLANQHLPIGAVAPPAVDELQARRLRDLEEREATLASKEARGTSEEG